MQKNLLNKQVLIKKGIEMTDTEKVEAANHIAEAICKRTCFSDVCGLCQLNQLKYAQDKVNDGTPVADAIELMVANTLQTLSDIRDKYDKKYNLLRDRKKGTKPLD